MLGKENPRQTILKVSVHGLDFCCCLLLCGQEVSGNEPVETEVPKRKRRKHSKVDRLVLD